MMKPRLPKGGVVLVAVFLLTSLPAWSQAGSLASWVDACDVTDNDLLQLLENEALLINPDSVSPNWDGTYALANLQYTFAWPPYYGAGKNLCETSPFYGQTQAWAYDWGSLTPFRSAVQVGEDVVLTAWHYPTNGITPALYAIFGLQYSMVGGSCTRPDFQHIPASHVFTVTAIVFDGYTLNPQRDLLLLTLDRPISSSYPRVRRSGQGQSGDRITHISHPEKLAAKVDLMGSLVGNSISGPLVTDIHSMVFSSGGMIYDRDERFLETVTRTHAGLLFQGGYSCWTFEHLDETVQPNDSVKYVADHIPPFELLVTPLDAVYHDCFLSTGTCTNDLFERRIKAPLTGPPGGISYEIQPPQGTGPQLVATFQGPLQGTLPAGTGFQAIETVNLTGASLGTTTRTYSVRDLTHGFEDIVRHVFNISP